MKTRRTEIYSDLPHPSEWKIPKGVVVFDLPETDGDWVVSALNYPDVGSEYWWLDAEYCDWLRNLVVEVKEQYRIAKKHRRPSKDFTQRYERHRQIFAEVPFQKYLMPSYSVILTQSSPTAQAEKRHRILAVLLDIMQRGELDYLRVCPVCQQWFIAAKSDTASCSKACRQKKSRSTERQRQQRRANYAWKKKQQERERKKHA